MPEVLIRGLVSGRQEDVETTQPTHKAAGSHTSYSVSMVHRHWADMSKHAFGCLAINDSMQHTRRVCCLGIQCLAVCNKSYFFNCHYTHDQRSNF